MDHHVLHRGSLALINIHHLADYSEQLITVVGWDTLYLAKLYFVCKLDLISCFEGCSQTDHFIDDTTSGPNITLLIVTLFLYLLRTHVVWCSHVSVRED